MSNKNEEGQVAPEVKAAWERFEVCVGSLLEAASDVGARALLVEMVGRVAEVDIEFCLELVEKGRECSDWPAVIASLERAINRAAWYAAVLDQIPPEEEEVPAEAPSAPEEVEAEVEPEPVEGTPLEALGLSNRVHSSLVGYRSVLIRALGSTDLYRTLYVEDILAILGEEPLGEGILLGIHSFGPKALAELKEKLAEWERGFLPAEESVESGMMVPAHYNR